MKRWWPLLVLVGLGLITAGTMSSASTTAPQAINLNRTQLSTTGTFAAYPDIDVGTDGLIAVAWTEGANTTVKHNGPLKLAWVSNTSSQWSKATVDAHQVFDTAVAVSGYTVHLVWSRYGAEIHYATCNPPNYECDPSVQIGAATAGDGEALQVNIVLDGNGSPHVVWVEDDNRVYYTRKEGVSWRPKQALQGHSDVGSEGPSIAYANGFIHLVWTEWRETAKDSAVKYCRRGVNENNWSLCKDPLSEWVALDYLARNLSIAADEAGNVYVVWDLLSQDDGGSSRQYAIGYKHSANNGVTWKDTHTYPDGNQYGQSTSGTAIFRSGEDDQWTEYVQFLRPHISLVMSGTVTVPVLAWHSEVPSGGGEEGLAQVAFKVPHKVYWTYATQSGSYEKSPSDDGYLYWPETDDAQTTALSTDFCGDVDMGMDSATARLALVGDLNAILSGGSSGNHLHAAYHEAIGGEFWDVLYNNTDLAPCFDIYLPQTSKDASGIDGGG